MLLKTRGSSTTDPYFNVISPVIVNSDLNVWCPDIWYDHKCVERNSHIGSASKRSEDEYQCEKQDAKRSRHKTFLA